MAVADVASRRRSRRSASRRAGRPRRLPWLHHAGSAPAGGRRCSWSDRRPRCRRHRWAPRIGRGDAADAVGARRHPAARRRRGPLRRAGRRRCRSFDRVPAPPALEPAALRARYLDDLATAGRELGAHRRAGRADSAGVERRRRAGSPRSCRRTPATSSRPGRTAGWTIPVGAAYLRRASDLDARRRCSPRPPASTRRPPAASTTRYRRRHVDAATVSAVLVAAGAMVLALLVAAQVFVARRTRPRPQPRAASAPRCSSPPSAPGPCWSFDAQQQALARSQRDGSDLLIVLSTARILALRSLSDENLHLIERGTEPAYRDDFDHVTASIDRRADGRSARRPRRTGRRARLDGGDRAHPWATGRLPGRARPGPPASTTPAPTYAAVDVAVTDLAGAAARRRRGTGGRDRRRSRPGSTPAPPRPAGHVRVADGLRARRRSPWPRSSSSSVSGCGCGSTGDRPPRLPRRRALVCSRVRSSPWRPAAGRRRPRDAPRQPRRAPAATDDAAP